MAITLYYSAGSAPCHLVLFTAKALNLDLDLKAVDTMNKQHLSPEYLKLNPQHTIPTIVDGDFALWESRAIIRYLVSKYGANTKLYPEEPRARAVVDQRLDFDLGTLYHRFAQYFYPQFMDPSKKPQEADLKKLQEALGFLNTFLEGSKYVAGADLTIADFAIVNTISIIEASGVELNSFPNIVKWYELVKTTAPGYEEGIQKNVNIYKSFVENFRNKKA